MCDDSATIKLPKTQRIDPRYPFQNQTHACYDNYCDYIRCRRLLKHSEDCLIFKKYYETICPKVWIEHWNDLRAKNAFPGPL